MSQVQCYWPIEALFLLFFPIVPEYYLDICFFVSFNNNNIKSLIHNFSWFWSGASAPWTGQIIVTEEEPAGRTLVFDNCWLNQVCSFKWCLQGLILYLLTFRGHCSWQTSWAAGDRGHQELCGAELEAPWRQRPWGCHVLCGKSKLLTIFLFVTY